MSNLPNDDQRLIDFLRQNRPEVPPSPPDLEEKLFCAIASSPPPQLHHHSPNHPSRFRQVWLVPPAIAASLALAWGGNYWRENNSLNNAFATINSLSPTTAPLLNKTISKSSKFLISNSNYLPVQNRSQNHQELVKIENFLENNWNGVVTNNSPEMSVENIQNEYLNLAKTKAYYPTKNPNLVTTRR
ncbi:hypothetical protein ACE1CI_32330 [Aerosakkonemataceae cyanobacterium BLCC-F50]|uniref:Uncharacterized protein n=1 Tax=Floridaenema flaviceps BLCC-F50 TaxID=3153642 RepID=A0ABV4Y0V8_9CYAN